MDFSDKIFLTFDADWAIDEVMQHTYSILVANQVKSTFL